MKKLCQTCEKIAKEHRSYCDTCLAIQIHKMPNINPSGPRLECHRCKKKVNVTRNKECIDCFLEGFDAVEKLPNYVEPIEPPLGNSLIGCSDPVAEYEINRAYGETPRRGEKPC